MQIREYGNYNEKEIAGLYESVGWTAYTDDLDALKRGFENSLLILGAYDEDELLGVIRIVGDAATIVYIQDILVFPEHQRKGVGTALLKEVLRRYEKVRQIVLTTDDTEKTKAFYKSLGLHEYSEYGICGFMK